MCPPSAAIHMPSCMRMLRLKPETWQVRELVKDPGKSPMNSIFRTLVGQFPKRLHIPDTLQPVVDTLNIFNSILLKTYENLQNVIPVPILFLHMFYLWYRFLMHNYYYLLHLLPEWGRLTWLEHEDDTSLRIIKIKSFINKIIFIIFLVLYWIYFWKCKMKYILHVL